jgi:hypothetical protein
VPSAQVLLHDFLSGVSLAHVGAVRKAHEDLRALLQCHTRDAVAFWAQASKPPTLQAWLQELAQAPVRAQLPCCA